MTRRVQAVRGAAAEGAGGRRPPGGGKAPRRNATPQRITRRVAVAMTLVVAGAAPAGAEDFTGRVTAGYNQVRSEQQNTDTFAQVYDLRFDRQVSSVLLYRLAVRAQDDLGTALVASGSHDYENREIRPMFTLSVARPTLNLQLGYDLTWDQTLNDGDVAPSRLLQHALAAAIVNPSEAVRLSTDVQWRIDRSGQAIDTSEVRGEALAAWRSRTVTLSAGPTSTVFQDSLHGFSRFTVGLLGTSTWSDELAGGRVTAALGNTSQWNLQRETSSAGIATDEPRREVPVAALYAVDRTPLDSRDAPLEAVPALLDGDLAGPTAIDLGPTGVDYQAIGVDMGRFVTFDELRIDVRTQAGNTVPRGGDIVFEVYSSVDARDWLLADAAPVVEFVTASSAYTIRFTSVTGRYVKVVTFGGNGIETRVTEVEVFSHAAFGAAEDRTSHTAVDSVQVAFSYAPDRRVRLAYTGLFNLSLIRSDRGVGLTALDWAQSCFLTVRPSRWLETQVGADNRSAFQSGDVVGVWNLLSLQLAAIPAPTFTATARATRLMATEPDGSSTTDEVRLTIYGRFLPSLDSNLELGYGHQVFEPPLDRIIDRMALAWSANAQLAETLRLTGSAVLQRADARDGTSDDPLAGKDYTAYGEATWRASQQLLVAARLGWAEGSAAAGPIQRYRLDWHPFPGGALAIGFSLEEDEQTMTGYRTRRVSFFPSWIVNRHATLNFNYTLVELGGPDGTRRNQLLFVLLTVNT
jgi:hypothetical protein